MDYFILEFSMIFDKREVNNEYNVLEVLVGVLFFSNYDNRWGDIIVFVLR